MKATISDGEVCANIGPRERRKRNVVGVAGALMTVLTAAALIDSHASLLVRCILQARAQTCVAERVTHDAMSRRIAAQARKVCVQASVAVAALTLLVMVIP